jgi:hypothetical protein
MGMWKGSGGWAAEGRYGGMYNPKSVEKISGEVLDLTRITPMGGMSQGMHLTLKTDKGSVEVHLGPAWYLERQDVAIAPGDRLEIKGSRVRMGQRDVLIAAEIKKGNQILRLRDATGYPIWSGWRTPGEN